MNLTRASFIERTQGKIHIRVQLGKICVHVCDSMDIELISVRTGQDLAQLKSGLQEVGRAWSTAEGLHVLLYAS
eukprot:g63770.t1